MRDTVVGSGHPGFTTNQPKSVSLYAAEATEPLFHGSMMELEQLGGEDGNVSRELWTGKKTWTPAKDSKLTHDFLFRNQLYIRFHFLLFDISKRVFLNLLYNINLLIQVFRYKRRWLTIRTERPMRFAPLALLGLSSNAFAFLASLKFKWIIFLTASWADMRKPTVFSPLFLLQTIRVIILKQEVRVCECLIDKWFGSV